MVASTVTGSAVEIVPTEEAVLVLTTGAVLVLVKEVNVQVELVMEACFFVFFWAGSLSESASLFSYEIKQMEISWNKGCFLFRAIIYLTDTKLWNALKVYKSSCAMIHLNIHTFQTRTTCKSLYRNYWHVSYIVLLLPYTVVKLWIYRKKTIERWKKQQQTLDVNRPNSIVHTM